MNEEKLIPHLFRTEYRKIVTVLCNTFGMQHIETAEDIASDTFLQASETWGIKGLPENPAAWLYTVAKNKAKNYLKRDKILSEKIIPQIKYNTSQTDEPEIDWSDENIHDSQLKMMFAVCHPSIAREAQVALALRILCGFGIDEIASAFLTNKETINKRLFRAKEKLRSENISAELPLPNEINNRLDAVSSTLYLLYNEGYYTSQNEHILRRELCSEAMRLTFLLTENERTNLPQVNALLALMSFHASRFDARINEKGELILYDDQDETLWDKELIKQGEYFLRQASQGNRLTRYHLEAAIAHWHTCKEDTKEKWESILQLYNELLILEYSPIVALNRTYALSKANSIEEAITEAEKLNLSQNHLYHALLGELYKHTNKDKAALHFESALQLAKTAEDKQLIQRKIAALGC
ncbi:sigma-70 family RNA polymerase sigma factor [Taibaiella lutea]|uniref:Sigma-70 family RNA polymerase sigma factor n=1 Tax=Taibaiella lutea TaxID=2608001 RepID=A0A5M6CES0_9BACT|nr:sigma-70 family RNA polymerase sigma factor [Taibaiella lutea]KAA5533566.1 sigma-70 family RNA polymerase sigma factor [Taibaiella lutea]